MCAIFAVVLVLSVTLRVVGMIGIQPAELLGSGCRAWRRLSALSGTSVTDSKSGPPEVVFRLSGVWLDQHLIPQPLLLITLVRASSRLTT